MSLRDTVDPTIRYVSGLALAPDGSELASVYLNRIVVWKTATGRVARVVGTVDVPRPLLHWSPVGNLLLTVSRDGRLLLRSPSRDAVVAQLVGHQVTGGVGVMDALFSPGGEWVISVGADHTVRRWDVARGEEVARADLEPRIAPRRLAFSPAGEEIVMTRAGGPARLLDAMSLADLGELGTVEAAVASPRGVVFGPDGAFLAALSALGIWMGRINDSDLRQIVALPEPDITHARFSRDGVLYTSTGRGGIRAWRPATGRMLRTFDDPA
ncbi:hypothetical protein LKO27_00740 [Tessaracoccus sp. OS52]|uniref:WD40 repeat domain-containing protein n=1 Tax=Tessaracoccus sp. OS52 TaxID=2886691 RepID=UPI001D11955D|nr:hypothetical protein [Tessaracoccus sp. OS52]MCC2591958.1 hypothetical protein [Tessaracoccus sp. OS52]